MYSTQGAKQTSSGVYLGSSYTSEAVIKLDYINIPLMGQYAATENLKLEFGPQVGFAVTRKGETTVSINGVSSSNSTDIKNSIKAMDLGLNNINEVDGDSDTVKNRVISVGAFYTFQ